MLFLESSLVELLYFSFEKGLKPFSLAPMSPPLITDLLPGQAFAAMVDPNR